MKNLARPIIVTRELPMAKSMVDRMVRAAKLDPQLYEEVEADKAALGQAMGVVWARNRSLVAR